MQRKLRELCVTALAILASQGLFAANIEGDATAEQGRIRLAGRDVLTFTQNGGFKVNKTTTVELLMVGGGGGGGKNKNDKNNYQGGGGGGGGGVVHKESLTLMPGDYSIVVGEGGAVNVNGGNTMISGAADFILTAYGGGAGANCGGYAGNDGGSGGGSTFGTVECPAGQAGYGEEGNFGHGGGVASHIYGAGGGGGAGAPGGDTQDPTGTSRSTPGAGGDGVSFAIVGTNVWYAGGGAGFRNGGGNAPGKYIAGGKGGGGACNNTVSEPGEDGLGGGGCGGSKGGSGVVIVSFVPDNEGDEDSDDFELTGGDELIPLYQDTVLVFRKSGTLEVTGSGYVEILAVGGGGGGGSLEGTKYGCGGGGAGGVVHVTNTFLSAGSYPIVIGEGGSVGVNGGLTEALGLRAFGGGAGNKAASTGFGKDGASGGGSANDYGVYATNHGGRATSPAVYANMGHDGGTTCHPYGAGGGGGAGAEGGYTEGSTPGDGGNGYCCAIVGTNVWYGGGGAGYRGDGNRNTAVGGLGGGGAGNVAGVDGFGGGGGGNAPGGKGVVIVRYRKVSYETIFSGAMGGDVACRASHFIHTFTSDGTFTMPTNGMVEVLLVGGGGGGGENDPGQDIHGGAGGGAGGVVHVTNMVLAAGAYSIKLGAGGAIGANGEKTTAFDLIAYGGGAGGCYDGRSSAAVTTAPFGRLGSDGASGGGSTHVMRQDTVSEEVPGGKAIYGDAGNLGHDGGICTHVFGASGGGGAGGPGGNTSGERMSSPGCGGIGYLCSISGRAQYYAGGGAGFRSKEQVDGGLGGGGSCIQALDKQSSTPGKGEDGLGGGGCGGAAGGKGVVIVRYRYQESPGMMLILR